MTSSTSALLSPTPVMTRCHADSSFQSLAADAMLVSLCCVGEERGGTGDRALVLRKMANNTDPWVFASM